MDASSPFDSNLDESEKQPGERYDSAETWENHPSPPDKTKTPLHRRRVEEPEDRSMTSNAEERRHKGYPVSATDDSQNNQADCCDQYQ